MVRVLLGGLTCDGQVLAARQVVSDPGPELLALAQPGVLVYGVQAAELLSLPETDSPPISARRARAKKEG